MCALSADQTLKRKTQGEWSIAVVSAFVTAPCAWCHKVFAFETNSLKVIGGTPFFTSLRTAQYKHRQNHGMHQRTSKENLRASDNKEEYRANRSTNRFWTWITTMRH